MPDANPLLFDILGPVMIGPSSSHTAGVARIAFMARAIFPYSVESCTVTFHGSLAKTYKGHGSDKAAVGGLLGILPDDERLNYSLELAEKAGLRVALTAARESPPRYHPNTLVIDLSGEGKSLRVRGASIGGGKISLQSIAGYPVDLDGSEDALIILHHDEIGVIASVSTILADSGINIAGAVSHRKERNEDALLVITIDGVVPRTIVEMIKNLSPVSEIVYVPKIRS